MRDDEVFIPPRVRPTDVRSNGNEIPEDVRSLQQEVTKMGLHRQLVTEQRMTDQILNPPMADPPINIRGNIDLGNFNIQEQQMMAQREAALAKQDAEQRIEKVRADLAQTQSLLAAAQLDNVKQGLETKIAVLTDALQKGHAQQPDFLQQLASIEALAEKLGYSKGGGQDTNNFAAQVQLKQLEAEMRREERRFLLEMERDKREWQMELKKLDQQNKNEEARIQNEDNKMKMLASLPEQIGMSFARGMMARGEQNGGGTVATAPRPAHHRVVEIGLGEWGEAPCDKCGTVIGVGPTSTVTACAGCGQIFDVRRVPSQVVQDQQVFSGLGPDVVPGGPPPTNSAYQQEVDPATQWA